MAALSSDSGGARTELYVESDRQRQAQRQVLQVISKLKDDGEGTKEIAQHGRVKVLMLWRSRQTRNLCAVPGAPGSAVTQEGE
jgi:hypothetical protein